MLKTSLLIWTNSFSKNHRDYASIDLYKFVIRGVWNILGDCVLSARDMDFSGERSVVRIGSVFGFIED